ncbi:hypothetical protein [Nocardia sp. Marseille-Q1738]
MKPDHAETFDDLMRRAAQVRVVDFDKAGREAYEAANDAVVGAVDRLVAVWDGDAGQNCLAPRTWWNSRVNVVCRSMSCGRKAPHRADATSGAWRQIPCCAPPR